MMRGACALLALSLALGSVLPHARAEGDDATEAAAGSPQEWVTPYAPMVRQHFYRQLHKPPRNALLWELLLPGAGNFYVGLYAPAVSTLALSLLGSSLWVAGAVRDKPALTWSGVATFGAARLYGVVSAPIGAALLNAAFRRQLAISGSY